MAEPGLLDFLDSGAAPAATPLTGREFLYPKSGLWYYKGSDGVEHVLQGVPDSRLIIAGNGLSGGGDLSADRTFAVNVDDSSLEINSDTVRVKAGGIVGTHIAAGTIVGSNIATSTIANVRLADMAQATIKGRAASAGTGVPQDLNATSVKTILALQTSDLSDAASLVSTTRTITAGSGLTGGGDLSADRTLDVQVDASTLEINSDTVRVKDSGITLAKLANLAQGLIIGRAAGGGTGVPQALNATSVKTILALQASDLSDAASLVSTTRTVTGTGNLNGGGDLSANRTLDMASMAQATLKGRAAGAGTGTPQDLNATSVKTILALQTSDLSDAASLVSTTRTLTAGSGLSGGGDLGSNRTFDVNVDGSSLEINSDTVRVKAGGITNAHLTTMAAVGFKGVALGTSVPSSVSDLSQAQAKALVGLQAFYNVVSDYGADASGATDNTTQLQAAIDAAANAGGGIVYFPTGKYKITSTLNVGKNGVWLQGVSGGGNADSGAYLDAGASWIVWGAGSSNVMVKASPAAANYGASGQALRGFKVHDLNFDARNNDANQATIALQMFSCNGWSVERCFVIDPTTAGCDMNVLPETTVAAGSNGQALPFTGITLQGAATTGSNTFPASGTACVTNSIGSQFSFTYTGYSANNFTGATSIGGSGSLATGGRIRTLGEAHDCTRGKMSGFRVRALDGSVSAAALRMDGSGFANTCCQIFENIICLMGGSSGVGVIELLNADSNNFINVVVNRAAGTNPGVRLNGSAVSAANTARNNQFYGGSAGLGGVTATNPGFPAIDNYWHGYQVGNGEPLPGPTIASGCQFLFNVNGTQNGGEFSGLGGNSQVAVRNTATQALTAALADIPGLAFRILQPGQKWTFDCAVASSGAGTTSAAGVGIAVNIPTGATLNAVAFGPSGPTAVRTQGFTSVNTAITGFITSTGMTGAIRISGQIIAGTATSHTGTVQIRASAGISTATLQTACFLNAEQMLS